MGSDMKIREELYIKMSNDYNSYIENKGHRKKNEC